MAILAFVVFVAACVLAACAPTAALNVMTPGNGLSVTGALAYGPLPRHRLDVYRPASNAPAAGWPVVVFFYGGSWNSGERADYRFLGNALASRGVVTLIADYRLYPQVRYPDFLSDSAMAAAYGLEHAARLGGDPRRVFVMGHSAGAYNAAMVALDARWLQATGHSPTELAGWIGLAGPYDFLPMVNPAARPVFFHPDYPPGSQPVAYAAKGSPPSFLAAAISDTLVDPQRNTVGLAARLRATGAAAQIRLYSRVNHLTIAAAFAWPLRWLAPVLDDVATFIDGVPGRP